MNRFKLLLALLFLPTLIFAQEKQNNFEISKSIDIYNNVLKFLNMNYVDEINPAELNETAIHAMLRELDPYTVFIPESEIEDVRLLTMGEYGGIGSIIQYYDDNVHISEPYENFPAHKAGLLPGDAIMEINGVNTEKKSVSEVSELLKGQPGSELTLKIKREGEKNIITKTLTREKIKIDNIPYYTVLDGGIAYIILNQFTKDAAKELKDAFLTMRSENDLKGLIIDLRGNGGGLLNEAVDIVNIFVPKNKLVVYTQGKTPDQNRNYYTKHEADDIDIPLAILVNESSASASEIVSGAIQDFDRGVIIGQRTFGKGLVQNILPMAYNTQMKVTIAKYYIPSKRCIQEIDYSKKAKNDTLTKNDTLGAEFRTANGRIVYEGHGIQPDVKIEPEMLSTITAHLYAQNMIFKYANKFYREHKTIASPDKFEITDEIYNDFVKFVESQDFKYTSESEKDFEELVKTAKTEGYYDNIKEQLDLLEEELKSHKDNDLVNNKKEISDILKMEIVSRYYFQKGRIISALNDDPELKRAVEILLNSNGKNEYETILKGINN
ncbi:MAG: S41 family peptidase [Bacteroidales bacterium]|nr:S41 family peptidase [Bacteroidales bacterium]MBR2051951.1 S41 family peptidase [Bacteroidales bacterium]